MRFNEPSQDEVDQKAKVFVRDYVGGAGKDRAVAKRLLMKHVEPRHDPMSKAIKRILKEKRA